jgi:hypothetical protein
MELTGLVHIILSSYFETPVFLYHLLINYLVDMFITYFTNFIMYLFSFMYSIIKLYFTSRLQDSIDTIKTYGSLYTFDTSHGK